MGDRVIKRERSRSRSPLHRGGRQGGANDRMIFITNLAYETRWMELKSLVREKGGEVNFLEILEDTNGKPKGCAIVEFKTREGAIECLKNMGRYEFMGRSMVCKEIRDPIAFFRKIREETGIDFLARGGFSSGHGGIRPPEPERPQRSGTYDLFGLSPEFLRKLNIEAPLVDRIFIANLSFNCGTAKVFEIFGMAGKIVWVDLHTDKEGRMKGTGVIQFSHPIEAVQAVSMFHGQRLYDRTLAVKMDKFEKLEKPTEGGMPRGLEGIGMGLGADGAPLKDVASVVASMRDRPMGGGPGPQVNLFQDSFVIQPFQPSFGGNPAPMGFDRPNTFDRPMDRPMGGMGGGSYDRMPPGNQMGMGANFNGTPAYQGGQQNFGGGSYGENSSFGGGERKHFDAPATVLIRNLPTDYTWQIVRERMQAYGETEFVDILAPGIARVRYRSAQDAERMRTTLSGTSVEGRPITVEFA